MAVVFSGFSHCFLHQSCQNLAPPYTRVPGGQGGTTSSGFYFFGRVRFQEQRIGTLDLFIAQDGDHPISSFPLPPFPSLSPSPLHTLAFKKIQFFLYIYYKRTASHVLEFISHNWPTYPWSNNLPYRAASPQNRIAWWNLESNSPLVNWCNISPFPLSQWIWFIDHYELFLKTCLTWIIAGQVKNCSCGLGYVPVMGKWGEAKGLIPGRRRSRPALATPLPLHCLLISNGFICWPRFWLRRLTARLLQMRCKHPECFIKERQISGLESVSGTCTLSWSNFPPNLVWRKLISRFNFVIP